LPAEVALRLLGRAIDWVGDEGPVELGKLEALFAALALASTGQERLRRTLAGAVVILGDGRIAVERAPPRRQRGSLPKSLSKSSSKSPPKRQKRPNFM
jgi:tRNA(Ile)-lysidine synthase